MSVLNCILFPLYRWMQRGCDSVWIDLLDVINVGRWRLLKAHRLQDRWIGMFHVKHRSINRAAWAGSTNSVRQNVWNQSCCSSCCCAPLWVWWTAYTWIPVDRWCYWSVDVVSHWDCENQESRTCAPVLGGRKKETAASRWTAGILPGRESHQATIWHL